jgi:hypothetical protein
MTPTVDDYINAAMQAGQLDRAFRAKRGEKMIHAGGRGMHVRTPGEHVLYLPNGVAVKVSTDDSGVATQVEDDEALHAVVRPRTIRRKLSVEEAAPLIHSAVTPRPIRTSANPRSNNATPRR